jgi:hypothetical protein
MSAFEDELSQRCFPRTAAGYAWWTDMNVNEFEHPGAQFLKVEDDKNNIVAYGKWNVPVQFEGKLVVAGGADAE